MLDHNTKMTRRQVLKIGAAGLMLTLGGTYGCARNSGSSAVTIWTPLTVVGDNDPILQAIEKATGVQIKLQQIDGSAYSQRLNASIATGRIPDIMALQPAAPDLLEKWANEGVIAAFEGKVADAAPNVIKEYNEQPALAELKINGKIYQQPIFWGKGTYPNFGLIHVRKDLLDKYGMAPPDTFDELFKFLRTAIDHGENGVLFNGSGGINGLLSAFAGAYGIPYTGWVKVEDHWEYAAIQPQMKEALLLFRKMVVSGLVNPVSWSTGSGAITARDLYVSGKGAALIFNGGGHVGRIQNDMDLGGKGYKEWLLPAPTNNAGHRGYTSEPQYAGTTILGNLRGNNPVGAAKVINYLLSEEGIKLTVLGIPGRDYKEENGKIVFLPQRTQDGFPKNLGDTGAHPLASGIVTWVPQEWQDFQLLYGKSEEFKQWYKQMWQNQGRYQIPSHGQSVTTPKWGKFVNTGNDLQTRAFLKIVKDSSEKSAAAAFDDFVRQWKSSGGEAASAEMSDKLASIYKE